MCICLFMFWGSGHFLFVMFCCCVWACLWKYVLSRTLDVISIRIRIRTVSIGMTYTCTYRASRPPGTHKYSQNMAPYLAPCLGHHNQTWPQNRGQIMTPKLGPPMLNYELATPILTHYLTPILGLCLVMEAAGGPNVGPNMGPYFGRIFGTLWAWRPVCTRSEYQHTLAENT